MLPEHLDERTVRAGAPVEGEFVLYWMRTAVRATENPALDVAICIGNALNKPVFVYHALSERYPFASDRHHTFILQGARDVQPRLQRRGVATAFHLERPGHRGPHLKTVADRACVVVTEDMPVQPLSGWNSSLADATNTPVWLVDTACVVPMQLVGKAHTRAFQFRKAIQALLDDRIDRPWVDVQASVPALLPALPFEPVDLQSADIAALVAECDIDHSIGPVAHTRGGAGPGEARWKAFVRSGLKGYKNKRNNPLVDGVSRMSAYLHYGMVSPMALAREADAMGAEKYVDELVIWREIAYSFCKFGPDPTSTRALPEWARATLQRHEGDPRDVLDWETLARGRTGDPLWDTAQHSLLRQGELHNNVRMTWGKAVVGWSRDAQHALDRLIDLNHRYALDGRDPASYGGILWALGQFDRPFPPEKPVLGTLRGRGTHHHAKRLDVQAWAEQVAGPSVRNPPRIAVVGAGIAGAACARTLHDHGLFVELFEASDRVGGRLGSVEIDGERLDVGAQHLTVRDPMVQRWMDAWCHRGVAARWRGPFGTLVDGAFQPAELAPRYVGVPRMAALVAHVCRDLTLHLSTPVDELEHDGQWVIAGKRFDWVVLALPPGHALVSGHVAATTQPVTTVAIHLPHATEWTFAEARLPTGPVERVVRDASRPNRPAGVRWMIASRPGFTGEPHELVDAARAAFALPEPLTVVSTRWDVGQADVSSDDLVRVLEDQRVLCGSCMHPGRIENALLSGVAAAGRILGRLAQSEL